MPTDTIDVNRRWWVLALLGLSRISLGFQFQTMGSTSEPIAAELGLNYAEIGTLIGLFMLPGLFLALPAGFASRYASDRVILGGSLALLGVGGAIAALADGFGLLGLGRIACGAGFVFSTIYFSKLVADWFTGKELATAMSLTVMTWPLGIALGQVGHEWLAANFMWQTAFVVASTYCFAASLLVLLTYKPPPGLATRAIASEWRIPRNELVLTLLASLVWAFFNAGYIVYLNFAPNVLVTGGYSPLGAATVISLGSFTMMLSGAVCGQLADRTGRNDLIVYICMVTAVLSLLLLPVTSLAIAVSLLFGLVAMSPAGVIMALTAEAMAPERRAVSMGVFFMSYFLVAAPAPAIAGWLYDVTGEPYSAVLFGAVLFTATAVSLKVFRSARRRINV